MIKLINYRYVQATPATLKQGVKNHRTPRGAVAGGNGSFIMPGNPPQINLLYTEDGTKSYTNIYPFVKAQSSRRVTAKYADEILAPLIGKEYPSWESVRDDIFSKLY